MFGWIRDILHGHSQHRSEATVSVDYVVISNRSEPRSTKLLKEATAKKRQGNLNAAIELLKQAYKEIEKEPESHAIKTYLRLPMLLQQAGRNDEAWAEFNRLLPEGIPGQQANLEMFSMDHSQIYDKMRLFLQREKKASQAVTFGVWSYLCWGKGLYYQKRRYCRKLCSFEMRKGGVSC